MDVADAVTSNEKNGLLTNKTTLYMSKLGKKTPLPESG